MANKDTIQKDLDFENSIGKLPDRKLLEFVARQTLEICQRCEAHDIRITGLENGSKRLSGITGGISGTLGAAIIMVINYFTGNNRS